MGLRWTSFKVREQLPLLHRYARALTRDNGLAEDLVHDALLRAYEKRHSFRPDGDLRTWLLAILHNLFVSQCRRERAERGRVAKWAELADTHAAPAQEHAVRLAEIQEAFASLPDDQRAALYLVGVEQLSYQEAAAALEIPIGTVMSRVSRARDTLRQMETKSTSSQSQRTGLRIVGGSDE